MTKLQVNRRALVLGLIGAMLFGATGAIAQGASTAEVYGFAMLDMGYNAGQIDPNWYDTLRVTKLPSQELVRPDDDSVLQDVHFGEDGSVFAGVRQSRLGVRTSTPTSYGDLKTQFEFEMFGTGVDEGQTTFRLRHAYGELGKFGAGQTWSPFMDPNVFPNSLEYWGPTGMVFFRNVQVRWMPIQGDSHLTVALERPGASADGGAYADRIALQDISARFPLPDFSAEYTHGAAWGYVRAAGILRQINWDDTLENEFDLSGDTMGWGLNLSSNLKFGAGDVLRLQYAYGEGMQNYMNDAPADIAAVANPGNAVTPVVGEAIPITGIVAFLDHTWNERWSSTIGYSRTDIDNFDSALDTAYKAGQYGLFNLLYTPVPNMMVGGELQWGERENENGFTSDAVKVQFSFKYNFSSKVGG
jgi:hypothetical protein